MKTEPACPFKPFGMNPIAEYYFAKPRKWRFDWAFVEQWIAVEQEGGAWSMGRHTRGSGFIKDMEKYNEAAKLGWFVFRFTLQQIKSGEAQWFVKGVLEDHRLRYNPLHLSAKACSCAESCNCMANHDPRDLRP